MQELLTRCDECGVTKKEGNRWIMARFSWNPHRIDYPFSGTVAIDEMHSSALSAELNTFCGLPDFLRYLSKEITKNLQLEADKEVS